MRKWLAIGVFAAILMASLAPYVAAATWIYYQGVWIKVGSLEVTSDWFAKNLSTRPALYSITVYPKSATVRFANPGGNLGGTASANFSQSNDLKITLDSYADPMLSGKHAFTDTIVFGDCDNCAGFDNNTLAIQGALWLMLAPKYATCNAFDNNIDKINCIKASLVAEYEPNTQWVAQSIVLNKFDLELRAWQDYDKDCTYEQTVYAKYIDYTLNADGVTYSTPNPPANYVYVWQYSYPNSLTDYCDSSGLPLYCDPFFGDYTKVSACP